ncbi:MAG: TlyA family RNA methyltransferase [Bacillota bacterium]
MRLDSYIQEKFSLKSKSNAQDKIKAGYVFINGKQIKKCGEKVSANAVVEIKESLEFVSKGGLKLDKGITHFGFDASGKTFVDVGASNGGFTHCLLLGGAKKVYAVDVGENQLDESLKSDKRVVVMDNTNARFLTKEHFAEEEIFVVSDVSFISETMIIPVFASFAREMLLLIKPQFECGKKALNKHGIVTNPKDIEFAIQKVAECGESFGYENIGVCEVSHAIQKNKEYMIYFQKMSKN